MLLTCSSTCLNTYTHVLNLAVLCSKDASRHSFNKKAQVRWISARILTYIKAYKKVKGFFRLLKLKKDAQIHAYKMTFYSANIYIFHITPHIPEDKCNFFHFYIYLRRNTFKIWVIIWSLMLWNLQMQQTPNPRAHGPLGLPPCLRQSFVFMHTPSRRLSDEM